MINNAGDAINILFISSRADVGGGPLQMFDIISNIDRSRFTPFAALPCEKPFYGKIAALGVKAISIAKRAVSVTDIVRLLAFVYFNNIHVIHSHGKGAGVYSRILKFLYPCVRIVHTFHGLHYGDRSGLKEYLHKFVEKALVGITDKLVNVSASEQIQNALIGILDFKRTVIIKNYLPLEKLRQIESAVGKKKYSAEQDDKTLYCCTVARFDPIKQMPFLVESFIKSVNKLKLSAKLILVGDGEELVKCKNIVNSLSAFKLVEFAGANENALDIMARCDLYILSSLREAFSFSTAEAIACGLPVLAPRVPGIAELVRPYEKGVMFENNAYASFEAGFAEVIEKYNKVWNKGGSTFNFAAKYEEHKRYIKKYEKLYIETINGR